VRLFVWLFVYLCWLVVACLFVWWFVCLCRLVVASLFVCLFVHVFVRLFVCVSWLIICLFRLLIDCVCVFGWADALRVWVLICLFVCFWFALGNRSHNWLASLPSSEQHAGIVLMPPRKKHTLRAIHLKDAGTAPQCGIDSIRTQ
jgi:hypothetical protein